MRQTYVTDVLQMFELTAPRGDEFGMHAVGFTSASTQTTHLSSCWRAPTSARGRTDGTSTASRSMSSRTVRAGTLACPPPGHVGSLAGAGCCLGMVVISLVLLLRRCGNGLERGPRDCRVTAPKYLLFCCPGEMQGVSRPSKLTKSVELGPSSVEIPLEFAAHTWQNSVDIAGERVHFPAISENCLSTSPDRERRRRQRWRQEDEEMTAATAAAERQPQQRPRPRSRAARRTAPTTAVARAATLNESGRMRNENS